MDCRGHGRSGKPHDPQAYGAELADDVVRLLDHLKITRTHVVGYSMGGDIANKIRERHPNRLMTVTIGGAGRSPADGWATVDFDITRIAEWLERGEGITEYLRLPIAIGQEGLPRKEAEEANEWLMNGNDPLAMAAMIRGYSDLSVSTESLKNNAVPTLVIVGENDAERPDAEKLKGLMSELEFVVIPGEDHFSTFTHPEFSERILGFLKKHQR